MDLTSLKSVLNENRDNYTQLQREHSDLANSLRQLEDDLERISSEHARAQNERERELADIRQSIDQREAAIAGVVENNVSLRFEINTYRRLLEVEEGHIQRVTAGEAEASGGRYSGGSSFQTHYTGSSSTGGGNYQQTGSDTSTKKMTVQKSARDY